MMNQHADHLDWDAMTVLSEEDVPMAENLKKIREAKKLLISTDWIILKISEALIIGADGAAAVLVEKYAIELTAREAARELINSLE